MNTFGKSLAVMGLAVLTASAASAQEGPRRGGFGGGMMGRGASVATLLRNQGVQEELKLDGAQKAKVEEAGRAVREKFASARESAQSLQGQERFAKMRELAEEADAEALKTLEGVLKPEQTARLEGIRYQALGAAAFQEEAVRKALKLTDEQDEAVSKAVADSAAAIREAFRGDREAAGSKIQAIRKEAVAKIEAGLSSEQKVEYARLLGAPFEVKFEGRGPGR